MTGPEHLIARAGGCGFAVLLTDDGIKLSPRRPEAFAPEGLMAELRVRRGELIEYLKAVPAAEPAPGVADANPPGPPETPEETDPWQCRTCRRLFFVSRAEARTGPLVCDFPCPVR